jgi:hypothetical protein
LAREVKGALLERHKTKAVDIYCSKRVGANFFFNFQVARNKPFSLA